MPVEKQEILQELRLAEDQLQAVSQLLKQDGPCQQVLQQLDAVQSAMGAACSQFLRLEIERCLQTIQDDPSLEQRCEEFSRLLNLYFSLNKFNFKLYQKSQR
jgi:DNA-binding FrmR family transcriptional regulator